MPYGLYMATSMRLKAIPIARSRATHKRHPVSVIEPAYTRTQFGATSRPRFEADAYREVRALLNKVLNEVMATAAEPTGWPKSCCKRTSPFGQNSGTRPAGSRIACDCFADLRRLDWWTLAFERICG